MDSTFAKDVFTPGRTPQVTYNPRGERGLEAEVNEFLQTPGYVMTVSGPTKSGKTVLIERLAPASALWVSGAELTTVEVLWTKIAQHLKLPKSVTYDTTTGKTSSAGANISAGFPGGPSAGANLGRSKATTTKESSTFEVGLSDSAIKTMREHNFILVIDDFHYIADDLKVAITRNIKNIIRHAPVVLIAVPYEAHAAVRAETEMGGRDWQLSIEPWSEDELLYISREGFKSLGIRDTNDEIGRKFAEQSLGAPFLMQQLCLSYCNAVGLTEKRSIPLEATPLPDLDAFLTKVANRHVPGVFDALRKGPRVKGTPRLARILNDGRQTDVYGAILHAVSQISPRRAIPLSMLSSKISESFTKPIPTTNIVQALNQMHDIAEESRGESDPALAFKDDTLYITDPFLSFYLRRGAWELPGLPEGE